MSKNRQAKSVIKRFMVILCATGAVAGCDRTDTGTANAPSGTEANAPVAVPTSVQQHADAARASTAKEAEGAALRAAQRNKK